MNPEHQPGYSSPVLRFATAEELPVLVANYPQGYRSCPTCKAYSGSRCTSRASRIVDGQPVGPPVPLDRPCKARRLKAAYL